MNALNQTFTDFTRAFASFPQRPVSTNPTVAEFFAWERSTFPRPYPSIAWAWSALHVAYETTDSIADVKARLIRFQTKERNKKARKHWSFDANRLNTWGQMLRVINQFENRAG